jgi:serine/threonine protein kinase
MGNSDLGACEWFLWDLRRSNLLDRGHLDQIVGTFLEKNPRAEPAQLAQFLIEQGILTQFQADRLLQGKTQGFVLGPYIVMDALGSGSMGTVYRAQSKNDGQWYAVKVLPRRSMWNVRLARRKVRVFEECVHPAVVPFVDVGTSGGMHYLAWPLVDGVTLDKIVSSPGKLPPAIVAQYAMKIAEGLEVVHNKSLFHGLIKPSNIMIGKSGEVYILDLGIGSLLAESEGESLVDTMSTANSVVSGLDCASPESIMDPTNLTPAGDQYSLGCVMYYCLTGRFPFPEGTAAEKMIAQQTRAPEPLQNLVPEIPPALLAVVCKLMEKAPSNRFATAGGIIEALRPLVGSSTSHSVSGFRPRPTIEPRVPPAARPTASDSLGRPSKVMPKPTLSGREKPSREMPTRSSVRTTVAAQANRAPSIPTRATVAAGAPTAPKAAPRSTPMPPTRAIFEEQGEEQSKFGPFGLAMSALLLSVLAWLVSWKMF